MDQIIYQAYLIFCHKRGRHPLILVQQRQDGWQLPSVQITLPRGDNWWREVAAINQAVEHQYALKVTTLACAGVSHDSEAGRAFGIFALETHGADANLPIGAWLSHESLDSLPLAVPELRPALERWLRADGGSNQGSRLRWAQAGWFDAAADWIQHICKAHGLTVTGPIEQVRSWFFPVSCA